MKLTRPAGFELLRERDYRLIWLAHSGSVIGDGLYGVALVWLTFSTIGAGPQGLAVLAFASLVPSLALGVLSGTLVDRWDRRRVMVAADLVRAAIMAVLAAVVAAGLADLLVVVVAGFLLTTASLFFYPARNAVLPAYVVPDELVPANALLSTVAQASSLLTPAVGALLFASIGPVGLCVLNGLSFVWSAWFIRALTPGPALPGPAPRRPLISEAADGLRFFVGHAPSRFVLLLGAANQLFASGPWRIMVPAWVAAVLGGGVVEYGLLVSGLSAGLLVSNVVMSAIRAQLPLVSLMVFGVFFDGLTVLLFAYAPTLLLAILAFFALGVSNGVLNTALTTRLQLTVPPELRGRTFATFNTAINLTTPVSLAVTSALALTVGPVGLFAASGAGLMAVGAIGLFAALGQLQER
jgi:sugar phosphate permease